MLYKFKSKFHGNSIKAKALRGSLFLAIGNILEKILAFVSRIILAKLLIPEELGLIVLITSITSFFECITEMGVNKCIVQSPNGAKKEFLSMALLFQSSRATLLYVIAFILTPYICLFYFKDQKALLAIYNIDTIYSMIRITFLSVVFNGIVNPKISVLSKQMNFKKVVVYRQASSIVGIIVTIVLTFLLKNTWAMIYGFICQSFLRVILSYIIVPYKPLVIYNKSYMSEILKYARGMLGAPIFTYFAYNLDIIIGGKLLGADIIGMYGFALILARTPRELFARIVSPTLLPAFAQKQNDHQTINQALYKILKTMTVIGILALLPISFYNNEILTLVYGNEFTKISFPFVLLCANALLLTLNITITGVFLSIGKPEITRTSSLIRVLILTLVIFPLVKQFETTGLALSLLVANISGLIYLLFRIKKITGFSLFC